MSKSDIVLQIMVSSYRIRCLYDCANDRCAISFHCGPMKPSARIDANLPPLDNDFVKMYTTYGSFRESDDPTRSDKHA